MAQDVQVWATPPVDGCLQPEIMHPADFTDELPEQCSLEEGALIETFAVAVHAATKAGPAPEKFAKIDAYPTIHPVDVSDQDLGEAVREATDGCRTDVDFETSGNPHVFGTLWELPAPGGTVVLVGIPVDPVPLDVTAQARELVVPDLSRSCGGASPTDRMPWPAGTTTPGWKCT